MASTPLGWPIAPRVTLRWHRIAGTNVSLRLRDATAGQVMAAFARAFHVHVEPIHDPGCWSYAHRKVTGSSTVWSEHAGGTAIDLNAPQHPLGRRGTFTPSEVVQLRRLLSAAGGVIRWGGDYKGRPDEMHFELVTNSGTRLGAALSALTRLG